MARTSTTMYFLARSSLFVVLAVQFLLMTLQFVLFLVDWALSSAEQGLQPLRFYLELFSQRDQYPPEQMMAMEAQLMGYRTVRWWRRAMDYVLAGLVYGGNRAGAKLTEWGVPAVMPAWPGQWRRPAIAPREFQLEY